MEKLMRWLVLVLLVAVVVLSVMLWNVNNSTARIEHYLTKPDGLNAWMRTEPERTRARLDSLRSEVSSLCYWAEKSAPADMKCNAPRPGPGGTGDPPKNGPIFP
jgi:hypothetical protein